MAHAGSTVRAETLGTPEKVDAQPLVRQIAGMGCVSQRLCEWTVAAPVVWELGRVISLREGDNLFGVGK
jgi:hypothetical protein